MSVPEEISVRVSRLREKRGWTQLQLAQVLNVSRNYVSMIEGGREPGRKFLEALEALEREGLTSEHTQSGMFGATPREKLASALALHGMSIAELGRKIGYDPGALRYVFEGRGRLKEKDAKRIVQILPELTLEDLIGGGDHARVVSETGTHGTFGAEPDIKLPPGIKGRMIPLLSMAQAGAFDAAHSDDYYDYEGTLALNVDDRRAFAIRVSGNSMEPRIIEGDIIICSPGKQPWEGCVAVVRTKSDQAFVKYWHQKGDDVVLRSHNKAYRDIHLPADEIAGAWPVVQRITSDIVQSET